MSPSNAELIPILQSQKAALERQLQTCYAQVKLMEAQLIQAQVLDRPLEPLRLTDLPDSMLLRRELHYHVNHILQLISSLLNLQVSAIRDPISLQLFVEHQRRINTIAMLYSCVSKSDHFNTIHFGDYLRVLEQEWLYTQSSYRPYVMIQLDIPTIYLSVEVAMVCGLILNELVSDALARSFRTDQSGTIVIQLSDDTAGFYTLSVRNDGLAVPYSLDSDSQDVPVVLVDALVKQIQGSFARDSIAGNGFTLTFRDPGWGIQ